MTSSFTFSKELIAKAIKLADKPYIGIIHPCSDNALAGAVAIKKENIAIPILIGPEYKIKALAAKNKYDLADIKIIDAVHSHAAVLKAIELVQDNQVQLLMKGSLHTDELMHPVLNSQYGIKTDVRITHCCVLDIPSFKRPLLVADIAINTTPDLECKFHITQNAINLALAIGIRDIKVAVLSAEEQIHPALPSSLDAAVLSKMAERGQLHGALVDGPLSFDTAISEKAADIKELNSQVAGRANILIAPTIEVGNAMVKQFKYFAKAIMPGIVIGAKVPIILTSRADDAFTRLVSCALGILYINWHKQYLKDKNAYFND